MDASRMQMPDIVAFIEAELARGATTVELDVLDPDLGRLPDGRPCYSGQGVKIGEQFYRFRSLASWLELAQRLTLRLRTPRPLEAPLLRLHFEPLDRTKQIVGGSEGTEKYGTETDWARIRKDEDPNFIIDLRDALERIAPPPRCRVLDLGVNTGDELQLMWNLHRPLLNAHFVGIDHSASAIAEARENYLRNNLVELHHADFATMDSLQLGRFDLVVAFGVFQSAGIDDRELLRRIVQDYLKPDGALLLGVPNCRYVDGEVEYGARMKNFTQPELGLVIKDIAFYRKYLQQHHKQVFVTGKHYLLVTAIPAGPTE